MHVLQQLAHLVLRGDQQAAQGAQGLVAGRAGRVPQDVGQQAGDEALAGLAEELGAGGELAAGLAADPGHHGLDMAFGQGRGGVDPVQRVEAALAGVGRVEGDDLMAHVLLAIRPTMGAASREGSSTTAAPVQASRVGTATEVVL